MMALWVALAGALGAICRFALDGYIKTRYSHVFPWATCIINVSGSFVLGVASGILLQHPGFNGAYTIVGAGFCGGYTTFSTACFETVRLLERQQYKMAAGNALGQVAIGVAAAALGVIVGCLCKM